VEATSVAIDLKVVVLLISNCDYQASLSKAMRECADFHNSTNLY